MTNITVENLYEMALALLSEDKQRVKDYPKFKIPLVNQIIAECFDINNSIRINDNLPKINKEDMPNVTVGTDVIPYDIQLLRECMPYGLASLLVIDDDKEKCAVFSNQYEILKKRFSKAVFEDIVNSY